MERLLSDVIGEKPSLVAADSYSVLMAFNPARVSDNSCLGTDEDGMEMLGRVIEP